MYWFFIRFHLVVSCYYNEIQSEWTNDRVSSIRTYYSVSFFNQIVITEEKCQIQLSTLFLSFSYLFRVHFFASLSKISFYEMFVYRVWYYLNR